MTPKAPPPDGDDPDNNNDNNDNNGSDDALLARAYADVKPLATTPREPLKPERPNRELAKLRRARASTAPAADNITLGSLDEVTPTAAEARLEFQRPGLQLRQWQKLRQGKLPCGLGIDLHGLTRADALRATEQMIRRARTENVNCILLVHGKGYGSGATALTLKAEINHWLRRHEQVLAFCSALPADGGAGAMYVLIKRTRGNAGDE